MNEAETFGDELPLWVAALCWAGHPEWKVKRYEREILTMLSDDPTKEEFERVEAFLRDAGRF